MSERPTTEKPETAGRVDHANPPTQSSGISLDKPQSDVANPGRIDHANPPQQPHQSDSRSHDNRLNMIRSSGISLEQPQDYRANAGTINHAHPPRQPHQTDSPAMTRLTDIFRGKPSPKMGPNRRKKLDESGILSLEKNTSHNIKKWMCPRCTYRNSKKHDKCQVCGEPNPNLKPKDDRKDDTWQCPLCRFWSPNSFKACSKCQTRRPQVNLTFDQDLPSIEHNIEISSEPSQEYNIPNKVVRSIYGATPQSDGVFFKVWAPNANRAFIAGSFNNWKLHGLEMKKTENGWFEILVPEAKAGDQYKFAFLSSKSSTPFWRNDPRTTILNREGKYVTSVIWDANAFKWEDSKFTAPALENIIIYELHVATFGAQGEQKSQENNQQPVEQKHTANHQPQNPLSESKLPQDPNAPPRTNFSYLPHDRDFFPTSQSNGTFLSCIKRLDYIADLGINAIELMPVTADVHSCCWGYDPISMFAIHPEFGTPEDLQALINEAHKRGIAVILDWVPNHICGSSIVHNWDTNDIGPYFYPDDRVHTEYGPRLDYSKPEVRNWLKDCLIMWFRDFHFDGIRIDSTNTMRWANFTLVEAWTLLQEWSEISRRFKKFLIAEDLQDNEHMNYVTGCESQWDASFFSVLYHNVKCVNDSDRSMFDLGNAVKKKFMDTPYSKVIYIESHDTIPEDRQRRIPCSICENPDNDYFAMKRSVLAAAVLLTSPGLPMLTQGQEFFEIGTMRWPIPPPIDWSRLERYPQIFNIYKKLLRLRSNSEDKTRGLISSNVKVYHLNDFSKVLVYHRFHTGGAGDDVIVLVNFSANVFPNGYQVGFPRPGRWMVRLNVDAKEYGFDGIGDVPHIDVETREYDGYLFSGSVALGKYSCVILSQDPEPTPYEHQ